MRKLIALLFIVSPLWAPPASNKPPLRIQENDGSPACYPWRLDVTNGALACNADGTADLTITGGVGGGGAGVIGGTGNVYDTPYVSVASSNTLSMSSNIKVFPSSVTILGAVPILSTSTLQSGATFYVSSGTVAGTLQGGIFRVHNSLGGGVYLENPTGDAISIVENVGASNKSNFKITATNGASINTSPVDGVDLTLGSIRWPDGTIQVSSPTAGGASVVLASSGIAFGSVTNTVTSDTNTIAWDNINKTLFLGSPVASIGTFKPRLSLYGDGSITDYWVGNYMTDTSSAVSHYYLFGKFGDGTGGAGNQDMSFDICQEGYDFPKCGDASSAYGDIVFANSIGPFGNSNFIFLAGSAVPMKLGNNGAFFAAGLNASSETFTNLTASRFVQTNANKNLVSYDLLNATQTWTGGNAFSSVTVQNITINGTCTGSGCGAGGGGAGVIAGIGNLYDIPYVSVASSNTLSMSGNVKVFPSSVTIMGTVPILSTSTLQSATTIYVASGTVATAFITNGSVVHKTPISINQPETGMVNSAINFSQQGTTSGSIQQLYYGGTGFNSSLLLRSPSDASFTHYTNAYIDPDYGFSVITGSNSPRSLSAGTTLGGPYDFSVSTQGYTSVSSIHWPDGTIQVSSPPVVVPTVLTSSGIAFGSVTNTVTSDTNTLTWNNTTKTLSASNAVFPTQMGVGSGSNLYTVTSEYQTLNFDALINNSFAFNVNSFPVLTISGTQAFFGVYTSLNEIAAPGGASGQATLWGDSTAHWLKMINNAGATYGIIGSSTTNVGGHFPMWSGAYGLKDYDLLNATQTWTGQQAWTSGQRSTFTVSPALLNVTNGLLATNSVGVIVSTTVDLAAGNVGGNLPVSRLNGGSGATSSTFWRGDATWATPAGGGGSSSLAVGTGTFTGFETPVSSPTANLSLSNAHFRVRLAGSATAFVDSPAIDALGASTGTLNVLISSDCFTAVVGSSGTWDTQAIPIWQNRPAETITILTVHAVVLGGTSLTYNIEERAKASLNSAGTDIYAADQTADQDGEDEVSFSNASIAADAYLVLTTGASAASGDVGFWTARICYLRVPS